MYKYLLSAHVYSDGTDNIETLGIFDSFEDAYSQLIGIVKSDEVAKLEHKKHEFNDTFWYKDNVGVNGLSDSDGHKIWCLSYIYIERIPHNKIKYTELHNA